MNDLCNSFKEALEKVEKPYDKIIFVCIGTDRSIGDSYGPIVGSMLKGKVKSQNVEIHGTIHEPVHALNLQNILDTININNNLIIAVDACLGNRIGEVLIKNSPIKPGSAIGKKLECVGDISMLGVVNNDVSSNLVFNTLQNTRLSVVYDLAKQTFDTINDALTNRTLNEAACTK